MSIKSLMLREWNFRILDKIFFLCIIPINMIELVEYEEIPMMELNQMLKLKEG